jgi:hypothetical protein
MIDELDDRPDPRRRTVADAAQALAHDVLPFPGAVGGSPADR